MERRPKNGELYRHFKNKTYQVLGIAIHSETREELVIYQALYGSYLTYVRPLEMFVSEVDHEKYPDVKQKYRFEHVRIDEEGNMVSAEEEASVSPLEYLTMASGASAEQEEAKSDGGRIYNKMSTEEKVMSFFDADSWEEKSNILISLRDEITDSIIDSLAVSMDTVIAEGPLQKRYDDLKYTISTHQKYEFNSRLR